MAVFILLEEYAQLAVAQPLKEYEEGEENSELTDMSNPMDERHRIIVKLANYCVEKQIIETRQVAWFVYGLEKRFSTFFISVPFIILAVAITNPPCAISFFLSFFFLRGYIGGFHASTVLGCLIISLLI